MDKLTDAILDKHYEMKSILPDIMIALEKEENSKLSRDVVFEIVNDVSTYEEHEFKDVTEEVYKEWKQEFPEEVNNVR